VHVVETFLRQSRALLGLTIIHDRRRGMEHKTARLRSLEGIFGRVKVARKARNDSSRNASGRFHARGNAAADAVARARARDAM